MLFLGFKLFNELTGNDTVTEVFFPYYNGIILDQTFFI